MKLCFIITLSFFISYHSLGQSRDDTQDWIIEKIHLYRYQHQFHIYNVKFIGSDMIIENPIIDILYNRLPLKEINQVSIEYFNNNTIEGYFITLGCKKEGLCVETGKVVNGKYTPSAEFMDATRIFVNVNFKNDDLPQRMKKALVHLIELNGGKVISDTF